MLEKNIPIDVSLRLCYLYTSETVGIWSVALRCSTLRNLKRFTEWETPLSGPLQLFRAALNLKSLHVDPPIKSLNQFSTSLTFAELTLSPFHMY